MLRKVTHNKFLKGSIAFTFTSFVASLLNYVVNLLVAHHLSLTLYGEYMTAMAYFMFLTMPIGAISATLIKKLGQLKEERRFLYVSNLEKYIRNQAKKYFWLLFLLSVILVWILTNKGNIYFISAFTILILVLISLISTLYNSSLQIFKQFLLAGLALVLAGLIKVISLGLIIQSHPSLLILYSTIVLASFSSFLFIKYHTHKLIKSAYRDFYPSSTVTYKYAQDIRHYLNRKFVLVPTLTTLGMAGLLTMDVVLAKKFLLSDQAGLYAGLSLLSKLVFYITTPITVVAYAHFVSYEDKKNQKRNLILAILLFVLIGLFAFIAYRYFAFYVVNIIFGPKFLSLVHIIWLAAIYGFFYSITNLLARFIIAKESWIGLVSLLALFGQVITISLHHQGLKEIININIIFTMLLGMVYILFIIHH